MSATLPFGTIEQRGAVGHWQKSLSKSQALGPRLSTTHSAPCHCWNSCRVRVLAGFAGPAHRVQELEVLAEVINALLSCLQLLYGVVERNEQRPSTQSLEAEIENFSAAGRTFSSRPVACSNAGFFGGSARCAALLLNSRAARAACAEERRSRVRRPARSRDAMKTGVLPAQSIQAPLGS